MCPEGWGGDADGGVSPDDASSVSTVGENCIKKLQCAQYITASDDLGKKNLQEAVFFVIQLYRKKQNGIQQLLDAGWNKPTSLYLPADVFRLPEASGPSDYDEQGVFMEAKVEVCGSGALRLLLDLPLQHPAGRHVGKLRFYVMSLKKPDSAFYYRDDSCCAGIQPRISEWAGRGWIIDHTWQRDQYLFLLIADPIVNYFHVYFIISHAILLPQRCSSNTLQTLEFKFIYWYFHLTNLFIN